MSDNDYARVRALPPLVSMPIAAEVLGMTRQNATALLRAGKFPLPVLGSGRGARVRRSDLLALFEPSVQSSPACRCDERFRYLEDTLMVFLRSVTDSAERAVERLETGSD